MTTMMDVAQVRKTPGDGALIYGVYMEGARWLTGEDAGDIDVSGGVVGVVGVVGWLLVVLGWLVYCVRGVLCWWCLVLGAWFCFILVIVVFYSRED